VPKLGRAAETKNVDGDELLTTLLAQPGRRRRQARNREIQPGKRNLAIGTQDRSAPAAVDLVEEAVGKEGAVGQGGRCELSITAFPVGSQGGGARNGGSWQQRRKGSH
jgi:hypothetical protein